jgi:hypothetical protein
MLSLEEEQAKANSEDAKDAEVEHVKPTRRRRCVR